MDKVKILPVDKRVQVGTPTDSDHTKSDLYDKIKVTPPSHAHSTVNQNGVTAEVKGQSNKSIPMVVSPLDIAPVVRSDIVKGCSDNEHDTEIKDDLSKDHGLDIGGPLDSLKIIKDTETQSIEKVLVDETKAHTKQSKPQSVRYPRRVRKPVNYYGFNRLSKAVSQVWKDLTASRTVPVVQTI